MKQLLALSILASTMVLTACGGGSSDSSGSDKPSTPTNPQPTTPTNPTTPANPTPTTDKACEINGNTVYATTAGCTFATPSVNNNTPIKYTCTADQRVQSAIGINAKTIVMNGITIMCKP